MRRTLIFGLAFGATLCGSFRAGAQSLGEDNQASEAYIDLLAADFYENSLRHSQSRRIEATTAEAYRQLSEEEKRAFRTARRDQWEELGEEERADLRNAKAPSFDNLSEAQKARFRAIAADTLAAGSDLTPEI